jgi:hypothetical protein
MIGAEETPMTVRVRVTFVDSGLSAVLDLLPDLAPATCQAFLAALPFQTQAVHAMYTGPELSMRIPAAAGPPAENQTCFPIPGDLLWTVIPAWASGGNPEAIQDLGVFYGRNARTLMPRGWVPGNRFAAIVDNLPDFAAACARCQRTGQQMLAFELLPD